MDDFNGSIAQGHQVVKIYLVRSISALWPNCKAGETAMELAASFLRFAFGNSFTQNMGGIYRGAGD